MYNGLLVLFTLIISLGAECKPADMDFIKSTLRKYRESSGVTAKINKKVTLALLEETKVSEGNLYFAGGKIRLEIKSPEHSIIVVKKDIIWVETESVPGAKNKFQVMKIKSSELSQQAKAPIAILLGQDSVWNLMKIKSKTNKGAVDTYQLVPKQKDSLGDIVGVTLAINKNLNIINTMSFTDELENETQYKFDNTNFSVQIDPLKFDYKPPKNAEVTEY